MTISPDTALAQADARLAYSTARCRLQDAIEAAVAAWAAAEAHRIEVGRIRWVSPIGHAAYRVAVARVVMARDAYMAAVQARHDAETGGPS